jgi:hypothetical protein
LVSYLLSPFVYIMEQRFRPGYHARAMARRKRLRLRMSLLPQRITRATEALKAAGLSTPETTRLYTYLEKMCVALEKLYVIKEFRNPVGIR